MLSKKIAERTRFELVKRFWRLHAFQACLFNHSSTSPNNISQKKQLHCCFLAEREGFEPPVPLSTTVFKTAAIDHSAISPNSLSRVLFVKSDAKVRFLFEICKFLSIISSKKRVPLRREVPFSTFV